MDSEAWQAIDYGITRVGHDLANKQQQNKGRGGGGGKLINSVECHWEL